MRTRMLLMLASLLPVAAAAQQRSGTAFIALRVVSLSNFPKTGNSGGFFGGPIEARSVGPEACLGLLPGESRLGGLLGGCAVQVAWYPRAGASVLAVGIAPRFVLARSSPLARVSLSVGAAYGFPMSDQQQTFAMASAGLVMERAITRHLAAEAEAGLTWVNVATGRSLTSGPLHATPLKLALGLQYRL